MANIAECVIGRVATVIVDGKLLEGTIIGRRCNGIFEKYIMTTKHIHLEHQQGDDMVQISLAREDELNCEKYITTGLLCKPGNIYLVKRHL